jgi:crotonobetainyl-CoA:carnitine CoA-transferase CaiB-like acyl-CoA transferase
LGLSSYFEAHNRSKRSIAIDLKHPDGRDVLLRLATTADAFINNFRIAAIKRLGLDYDSLHAVNPALVYVQASGFGPNGPDADAGAFDFLAQARGGFASTNGEADDPPIPAQVPIADQVGALHAAIALLTGLVSRNATGEGGKYDTSLLGSQISLQAFDINTHLFTGKLRARAMRGGSRPFWRLYRAGDGHWFVIGMLLDRAWDELCGVIGRPEIAREERFDRFTKRAGTNAPDLIAILDEVFATRPARHWVDCLNEIGMFSALVQDYSEVASDPQAVENGYIHEFRLADGRTARLAGIGMSVDGEPMTVRSLAPAHGEHTEDVLLESGMSWDEIGRLHQAGVIGPAHHGSSE